VLQCVAVRCSVLQCVAVRCSVLQCVAVCCSVFQCVAVCCKTYIAGAEERHMDVARGDFSAQPIKKAMKSVLGRAVCGARGKSNDALYIKCVAVRCSVLKCVIVRGASASSRARG